MTALVERVVWVSLATSLLLLPLLGLSGAIRRRYRAGSCYLLWLVLALRLLIPLPVPVPVGTALSQVVPAPAAEETLVPLPGISGPASVRGPQAGGREAPPTDRGALLALGGGGGPLPRRGGRGLPAGPKKDPRGQPGAGGRPGGAGGPGWDGAGAASRGGHPHDPGPAAPVIVLPPEVPEADLPPDPAP